MRLAALAAASALPFLSGCAGVQRIYLHDPQLEAATAQIKTDFTALKAPAYLEAQKTRFVDFAAREDAAVAALATSSRNAALVDFVRPSPLAPDQKGSAGKLKTRVEDELAALYKPDPKSWPQDELDELADAHRVMGLTAGLAADLAADIVAVRALFEGSKLAGDVRPTDCPGARATPAPAPGHPGNNAYIALKDLCANLVVVDKAKVGSVLANAGTSSQLAAANKEYQAALRQRKADEVLGKQLAQKIKALQGKADSPPDDSELTKKIKALQEAAAKDEKVLSELDAFRVLLGRESESPIARQMGLEALAEVLEPALAQAITPDAKLPDDAPKEAKAIAASLKFFLALEAAADTWSSKPDIEKGDALLIAIAELKHEQNMAALDVAWQDRRIRLLQAQTTALLLQAEQLVRAYKLVRKPGAQPDRGFASLRGFPEQQELDRARLAEALTAYATSWDVGQTPYWVLRFKAVQYQRMASLERAQQTEADTRAVLAPSINALAAGGAGGVKRETWATLLGDLSVASAILWK